MKRRIAIGCALLAALSLCVCPILAEEGPQPEDRPQGDALTLRTWSNEELEVLQQGLDQRAAEWPDHSLPEAAEIQLPQALALAEQALQQHRGLSAEEIATMVVLPYFLRAESFVNVNGEPVPLPSPYWQLNYADYTVYLSATNGVVLALPDASDGNG